MEKIINFNKDIHLEWSPIEGEPSLFIADISINNTEVKIFKHLDPDEPSCTIFRELDLNSFVTIYTGFELPISIEKIVIGYHYLNLLLWSSEEDTNEIDQAISNNSRLDFELVYEAIFKSNK